MTARVLGVLQVLFSLHRAERPLEQHTVARVLGQNDNEVTRAVQKLGRWKLVDPGSLRPTLNGELTVVKLRQSQPGPWVY